MIKCRDCRHWNRDHKRTGLCCKFSQMKKTLVANGIMSVIPQYKKDTDHCKEGIPREGK